MTLILASILLVAALAVWFLMRDRDVAASLAGGLVIMAGVVLVLPFVANGLVEGSLAVHESTDPTTNEERQIEFQP